MFKWLKSLFAVEPVKLNWYMFLDDIQCDWILDTNYGQFRGNSTVWRSAQSAKRCGTHMEWELCGLWNRCEWDMDDRAREGKPPREIGKRYYPGQDDPIQET